MEKNQYICNPFIKGGQQIVLKNIQSLSPAYIKDCFYKSSKILKDQLIMAEKYFFYDTKKTFNSFLSYIFHFSWNPTKSISVKFYSGSDKLPYSVFSFGALPYSCLCKAIHAIQYSARGSSPRDRQRDKRSYKALFLHCSHPGSRHRWALSCMVSQCARCSSHWDEMRVVCKHLK